MVHIIGHDSVAETQLILCNLSLER